MRVLIDADGCPVVDLALAACRRRSVPCLLFCDTAHVFAKPGAETITVSQGADSADFALVNRAAAGDVVVTQDYGLAAMCLARGAAPICQDGLEYTDGNIGGLLAQRHTAKRIRRAGGRLKGPQKRLPEQDRRFSEAFGRLLDRLAAVEATKGDRETR